MRGRHLAEWAEHLPRRRLAWITALAMAVGMLAVPALAQPETCELVDTSTEEVVAGVTLTWDSSFLCEGAADSGEYAIEVRVSNDGSSTQSVTLDELVLSQTTPRPRRQVPAATAGATGLPLDLEPGGSGTFDVSGTYTLVETDEGMKANLHLQLRGSADDTGEPISLGINVLIRGEGAVEDGDDGEGSGGPPFEGWTPGDGPPPGVGRGGGDDVGLATLAVVAQEEEPAEEEGTAFPTFPDLSDVPGEFDDGVPFVDGKPTGDAPDDPEADDAGPPFTPGAPLPVGPPEWADGSDDDGEGPKFRDSGWTPGESIGPPPWAGQEDDDEEDDED